MGFLSKLFRRGDKNSKKKVLSPKNKKANEPEPSASRKNKATQHLVASATASPVLSRTQSSPVDLDDTILVDENNPKEESTGFSTSPSREGPAAAATRMSGGSKQDAPAPTAAQRFEFSAGGNDSFYPHDPNDDNSSSSFNLSTDAEDTEYNALKHRHMTGASNSNAKPSTTTMLFHNNNLLDGEQSSVFPNLEDESNASFQLGKLSDGEFQTSQQDTTFSSKEASTTSTTPQKPQARSRPFTSPSSQFSQDSSYSDQFIADFTQFNTNGAAATTTAITTTSKQEVPLAELLAQAKSKRRSNGNSVNSAPAFTTAAYKERKRLMEAGNNDNSASSVSDIIKSLELTNASRSRTSKRRTSNDRQSRNTASDNNDPSDQDEWLMDEVTGALGPRGIAADLESLSGRSHTSGRSRSSSTRHHSRKSSRRKKSSSNNTTHTDHSSVGSKSVGSRRSRYSTKSYLSQMSEQSRSVANDLLRLEAQLAMVGSNSNNNHDHGSTTGSRHSRRAARPRISVQAPPGKLGIILANKANSKGTVVSGVRTSSVLADKVSPGDRIVAIDGEDVSLMTVSEITTIMARKSDFERTLTVLRTPRNEDRYRN